MAPSASRSAHAAARSARAAKWVRQAKRQRQAKRSARIETANSRRSTGAGPARLPDLLGLATVKAGLPVARIACCVCAPGAGTEDVRSLTPERPSPACAAGSGLDGNRPETEESLPDGPAGLAAFKAGCQPQGCLNVAGAGAGAGQRRQVADAGGRPARLCPCLAPGWTRPPKHRRRVHSPGRLLSGQPAICGERDCGDACARDAGTGRPVMVAPPLLPIMNGDGGAKP